MRNIQILLLAMFVVGTVLYFTRNRSRLVDRVFVLLFALAGVTLVCFPETGDWLATALGVGRGADAVIYFMLVALSYACLQLYAKIRQQDARLVELTRWIAIHNAKLPESLNETLPDLLPIEEGWKRQAMNWNTVSVGNNLVDSEPFAKAG